MEPLWCRRCERIVSTYADRHERTRCLDCGSAAVHEPELCEVCDEWVEEHEDGEACRWPEDGAAHAPGSEAA